MLISVKVSEHSLTEPRPGDPGAKICPQNHAHLCKNLRNVAEHARRPQQLPLCPSFLLFNSSHALRLDFLLLVEAARGEICQTGTKVHGGMIFVVKRDSFVPQQQNRMFQTARFTLIARRF